MKKVISALVLFFAIGSALAACPPYAPYRCVAGFNGKMICGCGV